MNHETLTELRQGLETAYIDSSVSSATMFQPQFISNDYHEGKKVLSSIEEVGYEFITQST